MEFKLSEFFIYQLVPYLHFLHEIFRLKLFMCINLLLKCDSYTLFPFSILKLLNIFFFVIQSIFVPQSSEYARIFSKLSLSATQGFLLYFHYVNGYLLHATAYCDFLDTRVELLAISKFLLTIVCFGRLKITISMC